MTEDSRKTEDRAWLRSEGGGGGVPVFTLVLGAGLGTCLTSSLTISFHQRIALTCRDLYNSFTLSLTISTRCFSELFLSFEIGLYPC